MLPFARITIIGLGLIGSSVARATRKAMPTAWITAYDADPAVRETVRERGARLRGEGERRRGARSGSESESESDSLSLSLSELSSDEESEEDDSASSIARRCSMMIRGAFCEDCQRTREDK